MGIAEREGGERGREGTGLKEKGKRGSGRRGEKECVRKETGSKERRWVGERRKSAWKRGRRETSKGE